MCVCVCVLACLRVCVCTQSPLGFSVPVCAISLSSILVVTPSGPWFPSEVLYTGCPLVSPRCPIGTMGEISGLWSLIRICRPSPRTLWRVLSPCVSSWGYSYLFPPPVNPWFSYHGHKGGCPFFYVFCLNWLIGKEKRYSLSDRHGLTALIQTVF